MHPLFRHVIIWYQAILSSSPFIYSFSEWRKMSAVESNCTTLMFTSDMLKKLRKQQQLEQLEQQLIPRPPGQPQQRQLPPNPGPVDSSFPHNKPSTTDHEQMTAPISADDSCIASVDTSQAAVIKPAKSTPSILAQLSSTPVQTSATSGPSWQLPMQQPQQLPGNWQLPPTAASGTSATSTIADGGSCKTNSFESLPAVMTDVDQDCYSETQDSFEHDSLDVVQQLNSSAAKNSSSKNSTPSSSFSSPGSKASSLSSSSSSRILKHISSGKNVTFCVWLNTVSIYWYHQNFASNGMSVDTWMLEVDKIKTSQNENSQFYSGMDFEVGISDSTSVFSDR